MRIEKERIDAEQNGLDYEEQSREMRFPRSPMVYERLCSPWLIWKLKSLLLETYGAHANSSDLAASKIQFQVREKKVYEDQRSSGGKRCYRKKSIFRAASTDQAT